MNFLERALLRFWGIRHLTEENVSSVQGGELPEGGIYLVRKARVNAPTQSVTVVDEEGNEEDYEKYCSPKAVDQRMTVFTSPTLERNKLRTRS